MTITTTEYGNFQQAFDFFNFELFANKLPTCLITLQRKGRSYGYYSPHRFQSRISDAHTDEIALNPNLFEGCTDEEILSTLVHEVVHMYQQLYGHPGRGRYHNREWADMVITRGLIPSTTGEPGGKQTGDSMSHYIQQGGRFERACQKLLATGFKLHWQDAVQVLRISGSALSKKCDKNPCTKDRLKFTCKACGLNAWAKPSAVLICGFCYKGSQAIQIMQSLWDEDFVNWSDENLAGLTLVNGG